MKKTVKLLDDKINVDIKKFRDGKLLLQANTGGGKSFAIRRICEQLYDVLPVIILDTEGEFHTLREKYDYILIGKGREITADFKSAGLLAHKLIEERVSAVIDLFEMTPYEREMFVKNFVEAMTNAPKKLWLPTLLVVDEAQTYAPEGDKTETGRTLHDAAFKFRKRHYGILFATPRIATLSKNVISTCKNKLIGYTSYEGDVKRAGFELGFTTKEQLRSLRDLDPGQFFAFGPAFSKEVITVQIGPVKTSHGDEGEVTVKPLRPSEKVKKALAVLATVPQAAAEEAKTVGELKQALKDAQKQVRDLARGNVALLDQPFSEEKIRPMLDRVEKQTAQRCGKEWEKVVREWKKLAENLRDRIHKANQASITEKWPATVPAGWMTPSNLEKVEVIKYYDKKDDKYEIILPPTDPNVEARTIGEGERKVLVALTQQRTDGATRELLTLLTGYKRSTRDAYIQRLTQKGYAELHDFDGRVFATGIGSELVGDIAPLPTGPDLLMHYYNTLPEGESKVLRVLAMQGVPLTRDQISDETGFKRSTRDAYIQRLRVRMLVNLRGDMIKISDHLV